MKKQYFVMIPKSRQKKALAQAGLPFLHGTHKAKAVSFVAPKTASVRTSCSVF
jgi:hypothetical protein